MHLHLDPIGGLAGDMFVAALLDLRPDLAAPMIAAVQGAGLHDGLAMRHEPRSDGVLSGSGFEVTLDAHRPPHGTAHAHVVWRDLRARIAASRLGPAVRDRAIDVFARLAGAEARVHGRAADAVEFHEVGAWDSIADIVAAAWLVEHLSPCTWSVGTIPLGSGRVRSAHGWLPVPAPATALLLQGFLCDEDGLPGERVTPTGAAILCHLQPQQGLGRVPRRLAASAHGFGTRTLTGTSNVLRLLAFDGPVRAPAVQVDQVTVLGFEVDDQTPEDLAQGLQRLRECDGVLDVSQHPVMGKKNRLATGVQLLVRPDRAEQAAHECFVQTTTLGVRLHTVQRRLLARVESTSSRGVRVKLVQRPSGLSAKADIDDVTDAAGHLERAARRRDAEDEVKSDGK